MTELIGFIAATLTTIAYLPQMLKIIKTKSAKGVSLYMYLVMLTGVVLWLIYGLQVNSMPIIVANTVTTIFIFIIIIYKLKFDKN